MAALAILVGLYPLLFFGGGKQGILKLKPDDLFSNTSWQISFYIHIVFGGLALISGWTQFSQRIRSKSIWCHRLIGRLYMVAVALSALAGVYIAFYATGGLLAVSGFICLGITWFFTTMKAYLHIRNGQVPQHRQFMIYSYACCFAAVTLRLWLPVFILLTASFEKSYILVAWWSWLPNLIVAHFIVRCSIKQSNQQKSA